jgi:hypothetical protein
MPDLPHLILRVLQNWSAAGLTPMTLAWAAEPGATIRPEKL